MAWKKKKKVSQEIALMKFLNYIEKQFEKVLAVDTEFYFRYDKDNPEK